MRGGQIPGHDVDQTGHRGRAGEPQDQDRAHVVRGPERLAQVPVGQIGQGPTVGLAARGELRGRDQHGGHEAGGDQIDAHDQGRGGEQLASVADPRAQPLRGVGAAGRDQRHHAHPRLKPGQAQHEQRKREHGGADETGQPGPPLGEHIGPRPERVGASEDPLEADHDDDRVEAEEDRHQRDGDADRLAEAQQEYSAQDQQQRHRDQHRVAVQEPRRERVLEQVDRGVGRRQGDRDDPGGGDEAQQDQDEQLAAPEWQQVLQHGHGALPVRALPRHPPVHRQHPEERECDY
jgi:hypothetical protein